MEFQIRQSWGNEIYAWEYFEINNNVTLNFDNNLPKDFNFLYKVIDVKHNNNTYYDLKLERTSLIKENEKRFYLNIGVKSCEIKSDKRAVNSQNIEIIKPYLGNEFDFTDLISEYDARQNVFLAKLKINEKLSDLNLKNDIVSKCGNYNLNFKLCYDQNYRNERTYYAVWLNLTDIATNEVVFSKKIKKDSIFGYLNYYYRSNSRFAICEYFFRKYFINEKEIDFDFGSAYFLFAKENNLSCGMNYADFMNDFESKKKKSQTS